tara:strand:- start:195 stop:857 length:663 start_codon:yes stop_codon:yes gene_type:complete
MTLKELWSSMTQANRGVSNIIRTANIGEIIEDRIIKELVKHHPTKRIDVNKVEWFKVELRPPFNTPALFYKYKNSRIKDDISWKLCIRNLYGKYNRDKEYEKDVKAAFRNESHIGTKKQYFINNTTIKNNIFMGICNNCNKKTEKITTDHYKLSYKEIFDNFININNINLSNIDIFENEDNEIRIKDENLASKWLNYHDNKAQYRLLCSSCNSHFGSYGY